jgi:hypothetical protein
MIIKQNVKVIHQFDIEKHINNKQVHMKETNPLTLV